MSYNPVNSVNSSTGRNFLYGGGYDPRVILVPAWRGSIYIKVDATGVGLIELFRKEDNDLTSFNWSIITGGLPGPPGPPGLPGPPGPPGVAGDLYDADISVQVGDFVYVSGANVVSPAIGSDITKKFSIGIVESKPSPVEAIVVSSGRSPGVFVGLIPNLPIFLSTSSLGGITQTPIIGGSVWRQILGVATSASEMQLLIQEPIRLV